MDNNDDYDYVGLSRRKTFDHFFAQQCYHCYKFNHFGCECPDKYLPATCGKSAGRYKTKDCNPNSLEKCANCVQNRERNFKHNSISPEFPAMVNARAFNISKN